MGLLVLVSAAVAWSLRRPGPPQGTDTPQAGVRPGQRGMTVAEGSLSRFQDSERGISVTFGSLEGETHRTQRLRDVEVQLPFVERGRAGTATIRADECDYQEQPLSLAFRGNVRVRTDDGFELETESLDYQSMPRRDIRTEAPVRFRRGKASGTAGGMAYRGGEDLQLAGAVHVRIEAEAGPPTRIESGSARVSRERSFIWFDDGVTARQGSRVLRTKRLQMMMTPDFDAVIRAAAVENTDLRIGGRAPLPGAQAGGEKRIRCRRLNMAFRPNSVLREVSAVNPASLEVLPGPTDPPVRRRIDTAVMHFFFDEQGRLSSLTGRSAPSGPPAQRRTVLVTRPLSASAPVKRVESHTFSAAIDPESGRVERATFGGHVAFSEPGRKAWAEHADFDEGAGLIVLRGGDPRVVDEAEGGELRAPNIQLGTRSSAVSASGGVRHTIAGRSSGGAGLLGGDEPVVFVCRDFDYDPETKTALYRDGVVIRSGGDEIRAPSVRIAETDQQERRLTALGGVVSTLHPRARDATEASRGGLEIRSRELVYDEKALRAVYSGDVEMRRGEILTKSPEAIVVLTPESGTVERVLAGPPVEVLSGSRRATGERGTYTPHDETFVLEGESVLLEDADGRVTGRSVSFQAGSDRIRVDGQDQARSEAVFKRTHR